jgi:hypothetical protein
VSGKYSAVNAGAIVSARPSGLVWRSKEATETIMATRRKKSAGKKRAGSKKQAAPKKKAGSKKKAAAKKKAGSKKKGAAKKKAGSKKKVAASKTQARAMAKTSSANTTSSSEVVYSDIRNALQASIASRLL